jgi:hypothetical protein
MWSCQIVVVMGERARGGNTLGILDGQDRGDGVTAVENSLAVLL